MSELISLNSHTNNGGDDPGAEIALYTCEDCGGTNMTPYSKQEIFYLICEDCGVKCLND